MNINISSLIPEEFPLSSKVWIYQANRPLSRNELLEIERSLQAFVVEWMSHGSPVKGSAHILFDQFIVLLVDESYTGISGCSTDSSVKIIKEIEKKHNIELLNRQWLGFIIKDKVELINQAELSASLESNLLNSETPYFNNTVHTKQQLLEHWIIPIKNSWLRKYLPVES